MSDAFKFDKTLVVLGDSQFNLSVEEGGLSVMARGISTYRGNWSAFSGETGIGYVLPYSQINFFHHFGTGVTYHRQNRAWKYQAIAALVGNGKTASQSVSYYGSRLRWVENAGVVNNKLSFNGSASYAITQVKIC